MSTLRRRLGDLASDAPPASPEPDLWDRAIRYHRRRRVGTAAMVAAAVLAVVTLVGVEGWQRSPGVDPAAPGTAPALPTRFSEPSPWLPGTGGEPTGPLAALITAERKSWFSSESGVVGVSATTGEYRFLDLPDDAGQGWALSPDGSRVAYWVTGETEGSPQTSGGQHPPVVGLAVWDARTGEVERHDEATEHGLAVSEDLVWADPNALVVSWGQEQVGDDAPSRAQGGSVDRVGLRVWDLQGAGGPVALGVDAEADAGNGSGLVLLSTRKRPVLDARTGLRSGPDGRTINYGWVSALSPDGSAIAYPRGRSSRGRLVVRRDSGDTVVVDEVVDAAVAWTDEDTVVFATRDPEALEPDYTFRAVSVSTGDQRLLLEAGPFQPLPGNLATDLLREPTRDFAEPASPWDPRLVAALVGAALVVALLGIGGWRRRDDA